MIKIENYKPKFGTAFWFEYLRKSVIFIFLSQPEMDRLQISRNVDKEGKIVEINVSGILVVDTSQQFKNELIDVVLRCGSRLQVNFVGIDEVDVSCIQLIVGFIHSLEKRKISYSFNWNLADDLKDLFENVGLADELYLSAV